MFNFIKSLIRPSEDFTSLLAEAARMEDYDVLLLASRLDKVHGVNSPQGNRVRAYVAARKRHFNPANF